MHLPSRLATTLLLLTALVTGGCSDDAEGSGGSGGSGAGPAIPAPGTLEIVEPGAPTICSRGTPFRFAAAGGDPKKLVLDFQGGGACWNAFTCSIADAIFTAEAPSAAELQARFEGKQYRGIYQLDDADNPVAGWTLIHIPYCTGDVHWGDATVEYSADVTIRHNGFTNAQTVLAWVYERYQPEEILVTGCSAGAYGAIGHAAYIAKQYPDAKLRVVADSGCGIVSESFFKESFPSWNAQLPTFVTGLAGKDILTLDIVELYTAIAADFPNARFAQQTTAFDKDQTGYYTAMGGAEADWSPKMLQSLADISAGTPNFRYYLSPGPVHCLHPYDLFYSRESAGTKYTDWLSSFIGGPEAPATVACQGAACSEDAFCSACLAGTSQDAACKWCSD